MSVLFYAVHDLKSTNWLSQQDHHLHHRLAGHTKFSPDWCFGLAKQKLQRSIIGCLDYLANVITNSAAPNITELIGLEDGTVLVPTYYWVEFLGLHFRKIPQINKQYHFIFTTTSRGKVALKEMNNSEEVKFKMLKDDWSTYGRKDSKKMSRNLKKSTSNSNRPGVTSFCLLYYSPVHLLLHVAVLTVPYILIEATIEISRSVDNHAN